MQTEHHEEVNDILCLVCILLALAFSLCFAGYCRQRDQIANYKAMLLALPIDARTPEGYKK